MLIIINPESGILQNNRCIVTYKNEDGDMNEIPEQHKVTNKQAKWSEEMEANCALVWFYFIAYQPL